MRDDEPGYDGQLRSAPVGLEAAHVRWFDYGGQDDPDNGLALCSCTTSCSPRGARTDAGLRVLVSAAFTSRTDFGRRSTRWWAMVLTLRPGTAAPAAAHVDQHTDDVFKGVALAA